MTELNFRSIKMLNFLKKGERVKTEDLAKEIGCKPRQIREYKILLEKLGYKIDSKAGNKNHGYLLLQEKLTLEELTEIRQKLDNEKLFDKILRIIDNI